MDLALAAWMLRQSWIIVMVAVGCGGEEELGVTEDALSVARNVPAAGECRTTASVNRVSTANGPRIRLRCAMTCDDGGTMTIYNARFERLNPNYAVRAAERGGPSPGTLSASTQYADRAGRYRADCRVAFLDRGDHEYTRVFAVADCAPSTGCRAP